MSGQSDPCLSHITYETLYGGGGGEVHRDLHKGGNGGKIQAMGTSKYFIVCQVTLLVVTDHGVKKKCIPCPYE